jgi:DNA-binding response OmpR family regulator
MNNPQQSSVGFSAKIMVVSDDPNIAAVWAFTLQQAGLTTCLAALSDEAIQTWANQRPDLIVVDSQANRREDIEICGKLRGETTVPILLFTPKNDETFLLEAYKAGIDDIVTQTVSPRLFLAKVQAWLRHVQVFLNIGVEDISVRGLRLDPLKNIFWRDYTTPIRLSSLEVRFLYLIMSSPGSLFETPVIIKYVWGQYEEGKKAKLKNLVYHLRKKIEADPENPEYLLTVGTRGYRFSLG